MECTRIKENGVSSKSIKLNFRWKLLKYPLSDPFSSPFTGALALSPFRVPVRSAGCGGCEGMSRGRERVAGGEEMKKKKNRAYQKKERKRSVRFRNGRENLRGAWRPSTRI